MHQQDSLTVDLSRSNSIARCYRSEIIQSPYLRNQARSYMNIIHGAPELVLSPPDAALVATVCSPASVNGPFVFSIQSVLSIQFIWITCGAFTSFVSATRNRFLLITTSTIKGDMVAEKNITAVNSEQGYRNPSCLVYLYVLLILCLLLFQARRL